ncbi:MAG: zinc carboxypeptidase [Pseudobdellovibrionaceae bacterium]|nr:zinc carboxypeptidase [Bdellovibrionales bacterium]USN46590.1 MAG: zinc carboxypeptidase [Pseudobdellovibrionaceae bacterium]
MRRFKEQEQVEETIELLSHRARCEVLAEVITDKRSYPIYGIVIGPNDPTVPTVGLFGGVHGLEKIGSHVIFNYLRVLAEQLQWDENLADSFNKCRLVSIPVVNPAGMFLNQRANPNGIDIMRNAPSSAEGKTTPFVSGHRLGPWLWWYRGQLGNEMEVETKTLVDFVTREMFSAPFSLALDIHSGFGMVDRLWYPYGKTREDFPDINLAKHFINFMNKNMPYNVYQVEPQSASYLIHGDVWDYLYDLHHQNYKDKNNTFLPWTLEMGSWIWMRKNPKQIFSAHGIFNPIIPHRYRRIMRRHRPLIEFIRLATLNYRSWISKAA